MDRDAKDLETRDPFGRDIAAQLRVAHMSAATCGDKASKSPEVASLIRATYAVD